MPTSTSSPTPPDEAPSAQLVEVLLEISLTGVILLRPVYDAAESAIVDFAFEHLNPAAQRMLRLPEHPAGSFLTLFPAMLQTEVFAFYRAAFASGQAQRRQLNYQHDGLDGYYHLVARRSGPRLVVSFTDTNDQDRSAVEEALRESQQREQATRAQAEADREALRRVLEQAPLALALLDGPQRIVTLATADMGRIWGQPLEAVVGRPQFEALPELRSQGFEQLLARISETGEAHYQREAPIWIDRAGSGQPALGYYNVSYQPLRDGQGATTGIVAAAVEVTEQVVARQQVQELNQKLEAAARQLAEERENFYQLLEQSPVGISLLRGEVLRYEYVNPVHQRFVPGLKLLGSTVADDRPDAEQQGLAALLRRVYRTGQPLTVYEHPYALDAFDGRPARQVYLTFTYSPLRENGQVAGVSIFFHEVTEVVLARQQREAQQQQVQMLNEELAVINEELRAANEEYLLANAALHDTQQQLRQLNEELEARVAERTRQLQGQRAAQQRLFRQAPMALVVLRGPDFIIEQANERAEVIWGVPEAEVLGQPHFEAIPGSAGQGFEELLTEVLGSGTPLVLQEVPIVLERAHTGRPNTGYYSIIFQPLRDELEQVSGIAVMWVEVTDQVLARQQVQALNHELRDSNERLTRANADLDTFVYTASHDLKSPITNIAGLLGALREQLPVAALQAELVATLLDLLDNSVQRFQQTLDQLTDLTRLQRILLDQPAEAVDLPALAEGVRLDILPELTAAQATLTVDLAACPTVHFPAKVLRSVLYNLLSNAVKYRSPDRPAQVRLSGQRLTSGQVVLTVHDNGLGLSETQQQRLFQLFERLHDHVPGSGVGLYTIKRLVDNAGGTLTVQSQPGVGSTFAVTLPTPKGTSTRPPSAC